MIEIAINAYSISNWLPVLRLSYFNCVNHTTHLFQLQYPRYPEIDLADIIQQGINFLITWVSYLFRISFTSLLFLIFSFTSHSSSFSHISTLIFSTLLVYYISVYICLISHMVSILFFFYTSTSAPIVSSFFSSTYWCLFHSLPLSCLTFICSPFLCL